MQLLKTIATIRSGAAIRGKVVPVINGKFSLVQIRDVQAGKVISPQTLIRVSESSASEEQFLRKGDVVIISRGTRNDAAVFDANVENVIASGQLFVIRPHSHLVNSSFLAWFLNQPAAQNAIKSNLSASTVPFLAKTAVEDLQILLPPLATQQSVVELHSLAVQEQELFDQIKSKRKQLLEKTIENLVNRSLDPTDQVLPFEEI